VQIVGDVTAVAAVRQGALTEMSTPKTALCFSRSYGNALTRWRVLYSSRCRCWTCPGMFLDSSADLLAVVFAGSVHRGMSRRGPGMPRWLGVASGVGSGGARRLRGPREV